MLPVFTPEQAALMDVKPAPRFPVRFISYIKVVLHPFTSVA
jgi:hypothetical protein